MGALYATERRLDVRLADPSPAAITSVVHGLNTVLRRTNGRAAFKVPESLGPVAGSPAYSAFVAAYDWADPGDPQDLYRELSIGRIVGTLHFLRRQELVATLDRPGFRQAFAQAFHPLAVLRSSGVERTVVLAADGFRLGIVEPDGRVLAAGPTFGEFLRYLALGWKPRTVAEEDLIGALMLKARLRIEP